MIKINLTLKLKIINISFVFFSLFFLFFPSFDIDISNYFFIDGQFISEKYEIIKTLRNILKNLMILIPIVCLLILITFLFKKNKILGLNANRRIKMALYGFILGPIIGCGLLANLYFKDTWGRARPVNITEFGGNKIFSRPFIKSDQCIKNCSWISGETSGAFSLMFGSIIMRNHVFIIFNYLLGLLVFFCRLSMGGHFFSDNIYAFFFMIYLAYLYRIFVCKILKRR